MLNLALVAVLSGSLITGSPDGDKDKNKDRAPDAPMLVVQNDEPADPRAITNDTFAFGRPADSAPIKLWVEYAFGETEGIWAPNGDDVEYDISGVGLGLAGDIVSQRAAVGVQLNVINFPSFKLGAGGELSVAQNKFQAGQGVTLPGGATELDSGFGLQQAKIFGVARGRVVGIHGGYVIDLGDSETDFPLSDNRDAIFFGGDFDYPSERFRLFGGIDYFMLQEKDYTNAEGETVMLTGAPDVIFWNMGAGFKFSVFELGAALMLRSQLQQTSSTTSTGSPSGGHAGSVAPYLRISPPSLPVSLFVKGAVQNEYVDYGYAIGGGNDIKPSIGFTAGLTVGFE